jgi:hypothetical protein
VYFEFLFYKNIYSDLLLLVDSLLICFNIFYKNFIILTIKVINYVYLHIFFVKKI